MRKVYCTRRADVSRSWTLGVVHGPKSHGRKCTGGRVSRGEYKTTHVPTDRRRRVLRNTLRKTSREFSADRPKDIFMSKKTNFSIIETFLSGYRSLLLRSTISTFPTTRSYLLFFFPLLTSAVKSFLTSTYLYFSSLLHNGLRVLVYFRFSHVVVNTTQ